MERNQTGAKGVNERKIETWGKKEEEVRGQKELIVKRCHANAPRGDLFHRGILDLTLSGASRPRRGFKYRPSLKGIPDW